MAATARASRYIWTCESVITISLNPGLVNCTMDAPPKIPYTVDLEFRCLVVFWGSSFPVHPGESRTGNNFTLLDLG